MDQTNRPIVVAYDGSDQARAAVEAASELFPRHRLIVVSVWEPGIAMMPEPMADPLFPADIPTPQETEAAERIQHDHATAAAEEGARLATERGATGEALAVAAGNIVDAILDVAESQDAAALVVGSRGRGAVKAKLFGSTSQRLLHESERPVVVVRGPH